MGTCCQTRRARDLSGGARSRVPWYAKALALCVAGYALSPIDLIPDFVPVLGYLDDVIVVPLVCRDFVCVLLIMDGSGEKKPKPPAVREFRSLPESNSGDRDGLQCALARRTAGEVFR